MYPLERRMDGPQRGLDAMENRKIYSLLNFKLCNWNRIQIGPLPYIQRLQTYSKDYE
jgi:hypothetical protein